MLPQKISFVDIETTGGRHQFDRIIEIGIVRFEDEKPVASFSTLINPDTHLPEEITKLTGINSSELERAPFFHEIAKDISEFLSGSVFVAHNVRFDYGFLKAEFQRIEMDLKLRHFCTVRLSRLLFPGFRHHNLDSIIERFQISCERRHRALDDARVLMEFYQKVQKQFPQELFVEAVSTALRKPSLPPHLKHIDIEKVPQSPGVYIFYGDNHTPLYIGKSKNLKERILSHFSSDIRSPLDMKISQQIIEIETISTAGELGALITESQMIKSVLPLYNRLLRVKRELIAIKLKINKDGFLTTTLEPIQEISPSEILDTAIPLTSSNKSQKLLCFFKSRKQAMEFLTEVAKEHGLCEKLLSLEKTKGACFSYRLGICKGACLGKEDKLFYNLRFVTAFSKRKIRQWPFSGPVLITERNFETNQQEGFVVNKWCLVGKITGDDRNTQFFSENDSIFDLDLYRILRHYFRSQQHTNHITVLEEPKLKELFLSS